MEFLKSFAKSVWVNHRKKFIAFVFGIILSVLAALTGIPLSELKEAAVDAANKPSVEVVAPAPVVIEKAKPEKK